MLALFCRMTQLSFDYMITHSISKVNIYFSHTETSSAIKKNNQTLWCIIAYSILEVNSYFSPLPVNDRPPYRYAFFDITPRWFSCSIHSTDHPGEPQGAGARGKTRTRFTRKSILLGELLKKKRTSPPLPGLPGG